MNKVMLITGASRGIGAATALLAARRGYTVCVNYKSNEQAALGVVTRIRAAGGQAEAFCADVGEEADIVSLFDAVHQRYGRLDGLVNNAGILEQQAKVRDMNAARLRRILDVNVVGPFICCREAVRRMSISLGGLGGVIVNVSSAASRLGSPNEYVDYAASKGALDTLTIGLSKEVADEGIRVNAVRPGIIDTDIHASGGEPGRVDRVKHMVPLRRGGTAEEVAGAIMWFFSEEATYSTGAFLDVSGGR
ncbi:MULTISPECIES: SDR family oxidoreductase [unclassified Achromobacter]|uniref:SDR family oxidoreductase n=1 Tax=unclassified Achromobacter TaxID=2626865 RepID=UPI000B51C698|nr:MULTISPECIES: SDR family oxidoreductase [unclassified Achromobacter]OWT73462.1 NAD(P)-dependent oxidoreductase [Achromobacter sp. HZ34]OWT79619.1 NAD(P)-dependent oxidoreductase [Achromobacter sp. HZ28]